MTSRSAALVLLLLCACGRDYLTLDPTTEAQAAAIRWTHRAAEVKGVRIDAVIFADPKKVDNVPDNAGAWTVCGEYVIGWNEVWLEEPGALALIPAYAAHEVCHIYYKDNLPCRPPYDVEEVRATECGRELLSRM